MSDILFLKSVLNLRMPHMSSSLSMLTVAVQEVEMGLGSRMFQPFQNHDGLPKLKG